MSSEPALIVDSNDPRCPYWIINEGTGRVWLGSDTSVATNSGVPLDGGAALVWTRRGPVFGVEDAGDTGTPNVYASQDIGGLTPSPTGIGLQVSAQMLINRGLFGWDLWETGGGPIAIAAGDHYPLNQARAITYAGDVTAYFRNPPGTKGAFFLELPAPGDGGGAWSLMICDTGEMHPSDTDAGTGLQLVRQMAIPPLGGGRYQVTFAPVAATNWTGPLTGLPTVLFVPNQV